MKLKHLTYIAALGLLSLSSCNDFLDEMPDNRVELDTPEKLRLALAGGYAETNYAVMCELSSDNFIDNHSPNDQGMAFENLASADPILDQYFAWEDADMNSMQDTPTHMWQMMYKSIGVANHVLEAIDEMKANGTYEQDSVEINAAAGEAYLMRAYYHFMLVNLFAMQYGGEGDPQQGIPYVTEPETAIQVNYERESVGEVYKKIEEDLLKGLALVNDTYYEQPKYHFNTAAANAFAARFYLFKRDYEKAEFYANAVLGANPSSLLRSSYWQTSYTNDDAATTSYYSSTMPNNLMLISTVSNRYVYLIVGDGQGSRYGCARQAGNSTITGQGPTWQGMTFPVWLSGKMYRIGQNDYGSFPVWANQMFQYTDKVAGVGYFRAVRAEFTGEQTLLTRAEALVYQGRYAEALSDLKAWIDSHRIPSFENDGNTRMSELTDQLIREYYNLDALNGRLDDNDPRPGNLLTLNIDQVCPPVNGSCVLTEEKMPYIWCILHFRRLETIFEGNRWFDIKRYGIEITHQIGRTRTERLTLNDPRRAFQVPIEALAVGFEPTLRSESTLENATMVTINPDSNNQ